MILSVMYFDFLHHDELANEGDDEVDNGNAEDNERPASVNIRVA